MAFLGKKILAIVPARGGSKGIIKKNIYPILGKPLINYTTDIIKQCGFIDHSLISTDDKEIATVSELDFPFARPFELSGDRVSDYPVIAHALENIEKIKNEKFDIVIMLQPTSPMRRKNDVKLALKKLIEGQFDSIMSVSKTDSKGHPFKQYILKNDKVLHWDIRGKNIVARQELIPTYHKNGIVYAFTRECILKQKTIFGEKHTYLKIDRDVVNIDTLFDIKLLETILNGQLP